MSQHSDGCSEYVELSRRGLFGSLAALGAAWLPTIAYGDDPGASAQVTTGQRDILVTIFLRGGADGLALCTPWNDNRYTIFRDNLRLLPPTSSDKYRKAINLDGFFGLPPAMAALKPLYDANMLLFAHMTGSKNATRSHFDAQQFMEVGDDNKQLWKGWVARHLGSVTEAKPNATFRALGVNGTLPLILTGAPKPFLMNDPYDTSLDNDVSTQTKRLNWLTEAYANSDARLKDSASSVGKTLTVLKNINFSNYTPSAGAVYNPPFTTVVGGNSVEFPMGWGTTEFGESLKVAAAVIRADVGVEAVNVDFASWDTHEGQGPFEWRDNGGNAQFGRAFWLMRSLSANLAAFFKDLDGVSIGGGKTLMDRVTVVVVSEFGRTVRENGNNGTDHGHGNVMMFLGKNVNGGRVDRDWKPLGGAGVDNYGGLAITVDHRIFLGELLSKRLLNGGQLSKVFPGFKKPISGWRGAFKD